MDLFTVATLLIVLLPAGAAMVAATYDDLSAVLARAITAAIAAAVALGCVGAALLQGDSDSLLSVERSRMWFASFDGASLHHASIAIAMAVLAVLPLRKVSVVAVVSVAILIAGLLFPIAAKLIWFGPLRRVGLIDLAGATVVLSTCGALSITLLRLTTNAVKVSVIDSPIAASAGAILTIAGWVGLLFSASVMQSPATPMPALLNVLRAITAAALVAAVVAKLFRKDEGPLRIIAAINLAAAMTTALAGRAPAGAAVVLGFIAGLVAPTITAAARGLLHRGPAGDFAAVTWAGGFIACLLAVPYSRDPDALHIQLVVQLAGFAACSGAGICAGILIAPFVKLLSPRQLNQPIAAS